MEHSLALKAPFVDVMGELAMGPVMLRRVFLILTRVHFSSPEHYGPFKEKLNNFIWTPQPATCTLKIENDFIYSPKVTDTTPAIFVGVGDIGYSKRVQDAHKGVNEDRSGKEQINTGVAAIILRHRAGQADECLRLAEQSYSYYCGIRPLLMNRMKFQTFDVESLRSTKPFARTPDQADQQFLVDLVMNLSFSASWTTFTESHRIKTISFNEAIANYDINSGIL